MTVEQELLLDFKFKSFDFGFIRFIVSSDFYGYLIHKISSTFDPSI